MDNLSNPLRIVKALFPFGGEFDHPFFESKQGVIRACSNIVAGKKLRSALSDDNLAGFGFLSCEKLHPKIFGLRIPHIFRRAGRFGS